MTEGNKVKEDIMTDMDMGSVATPVEQQTSTPVSQPADNAIQAQSDGIDRRFTQADIDRVAGKVRAETIERMRRESSIHSERQSQYQPQQQASQSSPYTEDAIRRIASESIEEARKVWLSEAQKKQEEEHARSIAQNFYKKIETGKTDLPDFDEKMKSLNYAAIPDIVQMATTLDNTAAVMYELNENKWKMGNIISLMQRDPQLAYAEMQRLSDSIKQNKNAPYEPESRTPLSQLKPSNQGMDRSGVLTVSDYRKKFKM